MWILNTNLVAYFITIKTALPYLRQSKGVIINTGSVLGWQGDEGACAYTATKGAIATMTKTIAMDEARYGVRCVEVKPGHINTHMFFQTTSEQADPEGFVAYSDSLQWMNRGGEPEEIAYAVLFLASPWASFVTGTDLFVTGGYEIGEGPKPINPFMASNKDKNSTLRLVVDGVCKDGKSTVLHRIGEIDELHTEADIGLIGAVAVHGVDPLDAGQGVWNVHVQTLFEHPAQKALIHGHHVVLLHEGHLKVDLGEIRLPVGPQILVPEAAGDLDVAVEAGDHEHLLEELGALGQGVEAPRMDSGRHQIIPGALRGAAGEDRGLDLYEAVLREV